MSNVLFINIAGDQAVILILFKNKEIIKINKKKLRPQGFVVLKLIDRLLKKGNVKPQELSAVAVISGPGPFSALRTGIVIANTLAKSLNIPVIGLKTEEVSTGQQLLELLERKIKNKRFEPVMPFYGKEPNITKPKHK